MSNAATFHSRDCARFFGYWNSLPKRGLVPDRNAFDPVAIRDLMPMIVMIEYNDRQPAVFRYAGSGLTEILGYDPTRRPYLELLKDDAISSFFEASEPMMATPCGGRFGITVQAATGYVLECEALDLPFCNEREGSWIIMALVGVLGVVGMHDEEKVQILEIGAGEWIDIGAGLPRS
ncbi:protein of unknown function DUF1457 [Parvibaculum lavamentivorans DS-1]|uniref:PAS domain-containing protein n=1 Tax=Parvibaculum lavamentivorans (strain DS-1 / DSM 13023 / NCIMB 13966) TaxID=402881 RepID=A7HXY8_PARL1|nr:PAS domain-containing protein [Parvibaculum lavamentivorans]ABS64771.1 protein of unknown function DUF1457 [Parvibaculum lavamentivorans DS-1]